MLLKRRRVVITGLGVVSPIGLGKKAFWSALHQGKSGAKRITSFDASTYPTQVAGEITDFEPLDFLPAKEARRMDRASQMIVAASMMALEDSKIDLRKEDLNRAGVFTGTAVGGQAWAFREYEVFKEKGIRRINPFTVTSTFPNATSAQISIRLGLRGPSDTISSGCASSTIALGYAVDNIRAGRLDVALVGGTEAPLDPAIFGAYCAARVMTTRDGSPEKVPRPFDLARDGIVLSEGAGVLVCETLEHAVARGARIYAEVGGWGHNSDSYHMILMNPDAVQPSRAMQEAIADAGMTPDEVEYVQVHAAGTLLGDPIEARALRLVFGERLARIRVAAIKSMLGHTQGACGAIESIAAVLAIHHSLVPPTINCESPDPECLVPLMSHESVGQVVRAALMNTFGFGGKNASIVFRAFSEDIATL